MSSIPGYKLEAYVAWRYNVTVAEGAENNVSVGIAEMLGNVPQRPHLTKEQFAVLLAEFEPIRSTIEEWLGDFDEENQSWRNYSCYPRQDIDDHADAKLRLYVDSLRNPMIKTSCEKAGFYAKTEDLWSGSSTKLSRIPIEERRLILREWSATARWLDPGLFLDVVTDEVLDAYNIPQYRIKASTLKGLWDTHLLNVDLQLTGQHVLMETFLTMGNLYRLVRSSTGDKWAVINLTGMCSATRQEHPTVIGALVDWMNTNHIRLPDPPARPPFNRFNK